MRWMPTFLATARRNEMTSPRISLRRRPKRKHI
jgi:hypothetical protein